MPAYTSLLDSQDHQIRVTAKYRNEIQALKEKLHYEHYLSRRTKEELDDNILLMMKVKGDLTDNKLARHTLEKK